jgi:hypothetical protein
MKGTVTVGDVVVGMSDFSLVSIPSSLALPRTGEGVVSKNHPIISLVSIIYVLLDIYVPLHCSWTPGTLLCLHICGENWCSLGRAKLHEKQRLCGFDGFLGGSI